MAPGKLTVDGQRLTFFEGETIAVAILAEHPVITSKPDRGRATYCGIGVCMECAVTVDGRIARACLTPAVEGMRIGTLYPGRSPEP